MAYRFKRNLEVLRPYNLGSIAHVPFLLSSEFQYLDEVNRYLVERAEGLWHPNRRNGIAFGRVIIPSANTMAAYSADLENWITYLEQTGGDWRTITYHELIASYDADMSSGRWSASGRRLSASTINRRVDRAIEFITWAADRGLRPPLSVVTTRHTRRFSGHGNEARKVDSEVRANRHRQSPKRLRLPTNAELAYWLEGVQRCSGPTLALMCEAILETGMRLEEVSHLREWQLPQVRDFGHGRPARMEICFGTKGGRRPSDGDLRGKARYLRFDQAFLLRLTSYRELRRKEVLVRAKLGGSSASDRLFLSEKTGAPIQPASLYRAWRCEGYLPFAGFSPHLGRHYFACATLMRLIQEELRIQAGTAFTAPASSIDAARTLVSTYLRPVLGHVSVSTTELYLDWLADELWTPTIGGSWSSFLEG